MTTESVYHAPVLANEVIELLGDAHNVLDGTLGGGGHALALLERGARVTAIDRDPEAIAAASDRLAPWLASGRLSVRPGDFADANALPPGAEYDGILLDLGVSSHQLDAHARGFTFRQGAPLDMRMDPGAGPTAADWLNETPEAELGRAFREFADEPRARRLARQVVRRRASRPLVSSDDFVAAIRGALGPSAGPPDFARLFQAVRIALNDELSALARALPALRDRLVSGGRMAVIAYHSGEDAIVKHSFRDWARDCVCPPRLPRCTCRGQSLGAVLTRRPVRATAEEVERNPRARSARLRAWQGAP